MDFKINIENMTFENNSLTFENNSLTFENNSLTFDMKGERTLGLDKSIVNSLPELLR